MYFKITISTKSLMSIPLGHFQLFYKIAVPGLKIQAKNSFLWILVHMIPIHHCAKEQFERLNSVQMLAPYWEMLIILDNKNVILTLQFFFGSFKVFHMNINNQNNLFGYDDKNNNNKIFYFIYFYPAVIAHFRYFICFCVLDLK